MKMSLNFLALLLSATALTGCADTLKFQPINLELPKDAATCDPFPAPPDGPLNCVFASGEPAMCQSEVAVWIETEVKPAYEQCAAAHKFLKDTR